MCNFANFCIQILSTRASILNLNLTFRIADVQIGSTMRLFISLYIDNYTECIYIYIYIYVCIYIYIGKDCCERQKSTSFGEELFIRIMLYCLPSQELFLTHVTAPHNRTESVICLHLLYICPITCICFQHLPYISSIHYSD